MKTLRIDAYCWVEPPDEDGEVEITNRMDWPDGVSFYLSREDVVKILALFDVEEQNDV